MRYERLEHTADVMVRCTGATLEECFCNAAYALSDQMIDASTVDEKLSFDIDVSGDDDEDRLFSYLSEVLFIIDSESVALGRFTVRFAGDRVIGKAYGEPLDLKKHRPKTEIKAVTYHMMRIDPSVPELTVVFDA
ncbi:MAG: archease [Candidatus Methanomethylophilaceae archaeon]|nr:archease [Candidatus Methanomethylophilaceae archaeon]